MVQKDGSKKRQPEEEQLMLDIPYQVQAPPDIIAISEMVDRQVDESLDDKKKSSIDMKKPIVMSNRFVVSLEDGTKFAHVISRLAISQIPMDAKELPVTRISTEDIMKLGYSRTRMVGHMSSILDEILSYRIKISSKGRIQRDVRLTGINVFASATMVPNEGAILVMLNPVLKEHFLNQRKDFLKYSLPIVTRMPGLSSSKLHELLLCRTRQYDCPLLRFHLDDLKAILNYHPKGEYKASTFVNSVIKRSVKAINELTECRVAYLPLRNGREYGDIRFYVEDWRTLEEKEQALQQEEYYLNSDKPEDAEIRALFVQKALEREEALQNGDGELNTEELPTSKPI